ncbi:transferase [Clostridium sp. UBA4548]|uniref:transferase n=1 Tax=Clostridium sp. UBA4548 TaxID=1946361 RepID=UPI0025BF627F|nr:transferase [Clostridium sp. UBA4548]
MVLSLEIDELINYVNRQMYNLFPDGNSGSILEYKKEFSTTIERLENCFKNIKNSNYCKDTVSYFNHLHSDQYTMFLWFLSNTIWKSKGDLNVCNKLFYMNKSLNGFSCMYDTELPEIFLLLHTVGTVLGKGKYSNYFIATQGCTVGAHKGIYPKIGHNVSLLPNSSIVGDCSIGKNVSIGINATVYNTNIEDNTVVFVDDKGKTNYKYKEDHWSKQWFK